MSFETSIHRSSLVLLTVAFLCITYYCIDKYMADNSVSNSKSMIDMPLPQLAFCIRDPYNEDYFGTLFQTYKLKGEMEVNISELYEQDIAGNTLKMAENSSRLDSVYLLNFQASFSNMTDQHLRIGEFVETPFVDIKCFTQKQQLKNVNFLELQFSFHQPVAIKRGLSVFLVQQNQLLGVDSVAVLGNNDIAYINNFLFVSINIKGMKMAHSRNTHNNPCVGAGQGYDQEMMERMMDMVGCRPPYWNSVKQRQNCSTKEQLESLTLTIFNKDYIVNSWNWPLPCRLQQIDFDVTSNNPEEKNTTKVYKSALGTDYHRISVRVELDNAIKVYEHSEQMQAYTLVSCLAELAGYVGVLLGYSVLDVSFALTTVLTRVITKK